MAPVTVAQRFGLKPEELNALTVLSGLEGYRGTGSMDPAAVAASTLQRRLSGKWGGRDIRNIATAPGQFTSILDRGITMSQLGDPGFGASVLGGQSEFNRIQSMINDPENLRPQMGKVGESFRALSQGPKPGDYIPVPGKSNFYFNQNPSIVKQGLAALGPSAPQAPPTVAPPPDVLGTLASALGFDPSKSQAQRSASQQLLDQMKEQVLKNMSLPPLFGSLPPIPGGM